MVGVLAYGAYLPHRRLERRSIGDALGIPAGRGSRAVASYDEDATTMGVEAGRDLLALTPGHTIDALYFATTSPPYIDKTNATAIHAALGLPGSAMAVDMTGATRCAAGAWRVAIDAATAGRTALAVVADVRTGLPGSQDEREGGDGAAAVLFGTGPGVVAEILSTASATDEFLDRWRRPGDEFSQTWEERFGEHAYLPLAEAAAVDACKSAGVSPDALDHVVVTGLAGRAVRAGTRRLGVRDEAVSGDLTDVIGNTGAAHATICLADVLDRAQPGETVLVLQLADGADAIVLRATDALPALAAQRSGRSRSVADRVVAGLEGLPYTTFLTWRGQLRREPPRRPDPDRPAGPPSHRRGHWKFAFTGSRCTSCSTRHLPPQRVCFACQATDEMVLERLADVPATIATYTVDHLAYSPSPPLVAAVVDFDGGGRYQCELTDVDVATLAIGARVEMTFRRLFTAGGVHDYFWKARPVMAEQPRRHQLRL